MTSETTINRIMEKEQSSNTFSNRALSPLKKGYVSVFAFLLNLLIVNDFIRMLFGSYVAVVNISHYLTYGLVLLFSIIFFFLFESDKSKVAIVLFFSLFAFLLAVSMLCLDNPSFIISDYYPVLFSRIVPVIILTMLIDGPSSNCLLERLKMYRLLWVVYGVLGTVFISQNAVSWGQYAGNFGFNLLLPFAISLYFLLKSLRELHFSKNYEDRKTSPKMGVLKWLFYSLILLFFIVLRGSRTAFLCAVAFFLALLFFSRLVSKKRKQILFVVIVIMGIVFAILFEPMVSFLSSLFPSSRTVSLLISGLSADSGRSDIYQLFLKGIFDEPLAFRGLFSDRVYYSNQMFTPFDFTNYPHSFFIEVLFQFGLVFGGLFLLLMVFLFFRTALILNKTNNEVGGLNFLFYFFFASGVFRLIFSGSYLTTFEFFAFLGIALKINILAKKKGASISIRI